MDGGDRIKHLLMIVGVGVALALGIAMVVRRETQQVRDTDDKIQKAMVDSDIERHKIVKKLTDGQNRIIEELTATRQLLQATTRPAK